MNARRLLRLAVIMESVPRKLYDQGSFGDGDPHVCKTSACLAGWRAVTHPRRWNKLNPQTTPTLKVESTGQTWSDLNKEFDLTPDEAYSLFSGSGCGGAQTPKQAAKFIRKFVAAKRT
jgi:hypothetical protein